MQKSEVSDRNLLCLLKYLLRTDTLSLYFCLNQLFKASHIVKSQVNWMGIYALPTLVTGTGKYVAEGMGV